MKVLAAALSGFLTVADAALKLDKARLLKNAIPVDKNGQRRRLDDGFEIANYQSINFNTCLSLKTYPDEDYEEVMFGDYADYTQSGSILAQKSYILFNVCQTGYCDYDDEANLFMTDLATYMGALVQYLPDQRENYCKACEEAQNYCLYYRYGVDENGDALEEDEEEEEGDEEEDGDEDRRRTRRRLQRARNLEGRRLANVQYIDCDTCEASDCFEDEDEDDGNNNNNNNENVALEDIAGWVENMLECQQSEQAWNDLNLYTGFMCNYDGTGVEVAVFLDEECSVYTSQSQYKNIMDGDDYGYYYNSQDIVTFPFMQSFDCAAIVEYENPYDDDGDDNNDENEEEEDQEANEYCQNLFEDDTYDLDTCGNYEEEEDNGDDEENQQNYNVDYYSYSLSAQDAEEPQKVCTVIAALQGEYEYQIYNADEDEGSGTFYNYQNEDEITSSNELSPSQLFGIILAVVAAVGLGIYCLVSAQQKKKKDSKKTPLVSGKNGAMT